MIQVKDWKFPLLFTAFVILFKTKFIQIVSFGLVKPLLSTVTTSNWVVDMCCILIGVMILSWFISKAWKEHRMSGEVICWILILTLVYIHFRFNDNEFTYTKSSISFLGNYALTDIMLMVPSALIFYVLLYKIIRQLNKHEEIIQLTKSNELSGFLTDEPQIITTKNDIFNRLSFAVDLKKNILGTKTSNKSFSVAINGRWGDGKTSFLNTMYYEFAKEDKSIVQLKFNPCDLLP